jgi:protein phosphatase
LLLCTDGLTDMVEEDAICDLLLAPSTAQAACDALVAAPLSAGGRDNVTVLLARFAWKA